METRELFNCLWSVEHYTDPNPELWCHDRIRMTVIDSRNPVWPVGAVMTCADPDKW